MKRVTMRPAGCDTRQSLAQVQSGMKGQTHLEREREREREEEEEEDEKEEGR